MQNIRRVVRVHSLSGDTILTALIPSGCEFVDFQNGLMLALARRLGVPIRFVNLTWPLHPRPSTPIQTVYNVSFTLSLPESRGDVQCCDCCESDCEDADDYPGDEVGGRIWRCHECKPCLLCSECRVELPNGDVLCLLCIDGSQLHLLTPCQLRRHACIAWFQDSLDEEE